MAKLEMDPRTAVIVLAGGASRRYGSANKLLADTGGLPLIRRVVLRVADSRAGRIVVVTGHQRAAVEAALAGLDIGFVHNARHLQGMGTTVAAGVQALPASVLAALITPGDLPDISSALIDRLMTIAEAVGLDRIVFPSLPTGEQRNPVLWPRRFFAELVRLTGDTGARELIRTHRADCMPVAMASTEPFVDIDRPEDLAAWRRTSG